MGTFEDAPSWFSVLWSDLYFGGLPFVSMHRSKHPASSTLENVKLSNYHSQILDHLSIIHFLLCLHSVVSQTGAKCQTKKYVLNVIWSMGGVSGSQSQNEV